MISLVLGCTAHVVHGALTGMPGSTLTGWFRGFMVEHGLRAGAIALRGVCLTEPFNKACRPEDLDDFKRPTLYGCGERYAQPLCFNSRIRDTWQHTAVPLSTGENRESYTQSVSLTANRTTPLTMVMRL